MFRNEDPVGINVGISFVGMVSAIVNFLMLGLARTQLIVFLAILIYSFATSTYSGLREIIGHLVPPTKLRVVWYGTISIRVQYKYGSTTDELKPDDDEVTDEW